MNADISSLKCWLTQTHTQTRTTHILIQRLWNRHWIWYAHIGRKTCHLTWKAGLAITFSLPVGESLSLCLYGRRCKKKRWVEQKQRHRVHFYRMENKNRHKLMKGSDICSHFTSLAWHKRLETQNPVAINSSLTARYSQRSVNHTQTLIHTHTFPLWQEVASNVGRGVNIWGKSTINREHCGCGWQMQTLERGREERPHYTNLQHHGLLGLDYMWENIGCVFKESCVSHRQQNHSDCPLRTSEEVRIMTSLYSAS